MNSEELGLAFLCLNMALLGGAVGFMLGWRNRQRFTTPFLDKSHKRNMSMLDAITKTDISKVDTEGEEWKP